MGEARQSLGKNPIACRAQPIKQRWVLNGFSHNITVA
jgi:hypothetical protein